MLCNCKPPREILFTKPSSFEFPQVGAWRLAAPKRKSSSCNSVACPVSISVGGFFDKAHAEELNLLWFAITSRSGNFAISRWACMTPRRACVFARASGTKVGGRARLDPAYGWYASGWDHPQPCRAGARRLMDDERGLVRSADSPLIQALKVCRRRPTNSLCMRDIAS